jgi:hypothetical protein
VHRHHGVVFLGCKQGVVRRPQLQTQQQRLGPAEQEEAERRDQVHDADPLVVAGRDPVEPTGGRRCDATRDDLGGWRATQFDGHRYGSERA